MLYVTDNTCQCSVISVGWIKKLLSVVQKELKAKFGEFVKIYN
jgi:hypothetical protein